MRRHLRIWAWSLLVAYSLWVVRAAIPMVYFYANHKSIVATLCENKSKPALKCDGKCYLKKQISQAEKGNSKSHQKVEAKVWAEEIAHPNSIFLFSEFNLLYVFGFPSFACEVLNNFFPISVPPPDL